MVAVVLVYAGFGETRAAPVSIDSSYYFTNGVISRQVLENYLSRSITQAELIASEGCYNDGPYPDKGDDYRMLKNVGAKFIGRSIYSWGKEQFFLIPAFWANAKAAIDAVHALDSTVVFQAAIFEIVTEKVEDIPVPAWVFSAFGLPAEQRNFSYRAMLNRDGHLVDHWRSGSSVPDITQQETRLFFYYLARRYMEVGIEAIHFGQAQLMAMNHGQAGLVAWKELLDKVRYSAKNVARRGTVICDSHLPNGGMVLGDRLLFDFVSFPLRLKEILDEPQKVELEVGYLDGIYRRTAGGITPSGWSCNHSLFLVEFDNFGISRHRDEPDHGDHFAWGYDEITWFHKQPEAYRNEFLRYAHQWVRQTDPNGFLQMPGSRIVTGAETNRYRANAYGPGCRTGKAQETTIKEIWMHPAGEPVYPSYTGLVMAGYQGWFAAEGDDSNRGWYHYRGRGGIFAPGNTNVDFWPDVREYTKTYKSPFQFADGRDAYLYSPYDEESVDLHFRWMKEYGIDGVHMQRFVSEIKNPSGKRHFNKVLENALKAAKQYGRAISVMYDLSGCRSEDVALVEADWAELVETFKLTDPAVNPTYLWHNGKPLVTIWGVGFNDRRRYTIEDVTHLVARLKSPGKNVSIMLGVPYYWSSLGRDTEPSEALHHLIKKADIVMPWAVGRYNNKTFDPSVIAADIAWCTENHVDYVPLVFPGFSWGNMHQNPKIYDQIPRLKGDFFWQQVAAAKQAGAKSLYIAMFDEIDEGTAIFKTVNEKDTPLNGADGLRFVGIENDLPTDHYLWLAGQAGAWIRGDRSYSDMRPSRIELSR